MFILLLTSIINASNHAKCVSLNNQKCKIQPTLGNLHPNEYSQELSCYSDNCEMVLLDKCVRNGNTLNDVSNKVCVLNKTEDWIINVFNRIAGKNDCKCNSC